MDPNSLSVAFINRLGCRLKGLPCTSINFGPFSGVGMAADYAQSMRAIGLPPMPPAACAQAFSGAGYSGKAIQTGMDLARFSLVNQTKSKWPFVAQLQALPQVKAKSHSANRQVWQAKAVIELA